MLKINQFTFGHPNRPVLIIIAHGPEEEKEHNLRVLIMSHSSFCQKTREYNQTITHMKLTHTTRDLDHVIEE